MIYPLNMGIFHGYVSLPEGKPSDDDDDDGGGGGDEDEF